MESLTRTLPLGLEGVLENRHAAREFLQTEVLYFSIADFPLTFLR